MEVTTDKQRELRQREIAEEEKQAKEELEKKRRNKNFTQIYPKGWKRVKELTKKKGGSGALGLYAFFAEHIDPTCGAVIADQQFLADQMEVSTRTIQRWLNFLEEENALVRIPVAGRICAYALDPHEVWKGYDNTKEYAAFVTRTLVKKDGEIKRRITSMFSQEQEEEKEAA